MPRSAYKPEVPRPGTEEKTNQKNMDNAYTILNRFEGRLESIENSISIGGVSVVTIEMLNDVAEFAFMMGME